MKALAMVICLALSVIAVCALSIAMKHQRKNDEEMEQFFRDKLALGMYIPPESFNKILYGYNSKGGEIYENLDVRGEEPESETSD